jgi:2'-5' RNA ligase
LFKIDVMQTDALYDYRLIIQPDTQTLQDVQMYQHLISEHTGHPAVHSKTHIALFRSEFPKQYEQAFIQMVQAITLSQTPFTIYTARIDQKVLATDKHMLFVNIANPKPIIQLHQNLVQAFELKSHNYVPHLTLANGISYRTFQELAPYFMNKIFVRSFFCEELVLIRKPVNQAGASYETVSTFKFKQAFAQQALDLLHTAA